MKEIHVRDNNGGPLLQWKELDFNVTSDKKFQLNLPLILKSSQSAKLFDIKVDDAGDITATEIT